MIVPGGPPARVVEVVAAVVNLPVSADLTGTSRQEMFRTVRGDHTLAGVYHREALQGQRVIKLSKLNISETLAIASLDKEYCLARVLEAS